MAAMLEGFVDKVVEIVTNDGRVIVGLLKGFDQTTNVILDECHERVFSSTAGVEQVRSLAQSSLRRATSYGRKLIFFVLSHARRSSSASILCVATTCACRDSISFYSLTLLC